MDTRFLYARKDEGARCALTGTDVQHVRARKAWNGDSCIIASYAAACHAHGKGNRADEYVCYFFWLRKETWNRRNQTDALQTKTNRTAGGRVSRRLALHTLPAFRPRQHALSRQRGRVKHRTVGGTGALLCGPALTLAAAPCPTGPPAWAASPEA